MHINVWKKIVHECRVCDDLREVKHLNVLTINRYVIVVKFTLPF
jgi:hypothetical protein